MGDCEAVRAGGGGVNWYRWDRVHRAASRRFTRHQLAGVPLRERWDRYDRVMALAWAKLEAGQ
jgi:hypothetical protein